MSSYRIFLPGESLPASKLQDLGLAGTYTPALQAVTTSPTLGSGATATGDWHLNNGIVTLGWTIQFGTAGVAAGSGTYRVTLPTVLNSSPPIALGLDADWQDNRCIGQVMLNDNSAGAAGFFPYFVRTSSGNPDTLVFNSPDSSSSLASNTSPWTWAANDYLRGSVRYKTDFT